MKQVNRKDFLKKGAAALAGAGLIATGCGNESAVQAGEAPNINLNKTYKWKMVTTWPPNFPVLGEGCNLFAQWVKEMSGGRMDIQVYGAGELVPPFESFYAVSTGVAEMSNGAGYYWAGMVPAAQFFASVPFGMNAQQMNSWILSGGGQALWDELYAPLNLVPMASGNTGVQMGGWFNKEINSIADLNGLRMRIPGLGGKVFSEAGGTVLQVAGGEIYTNLERGVIDATEWVGPYHDYKMGFHKIAKYYYYPGWHEAGTTLETAVNKQKFDALPADLQEIIRTAAMRQNIWTLSEFEARNSEYLEILLQEEKVDLRAFPSEMIKSLRGLTEGVLGKIIQEDPKSAKVYDAYATFFKRIKTYSAVSEKTYYNLIADSGSV